MDDVLPLPPLVFGETHAFALMIRGIRECDPGLEIAARAELHRLGIAVVFDESVWGRRPQPALPGFVDAVSFDPGLSPNEKSSGDGYHPAPRALAQKPVTLFFGLR